MGIFIMFHDISYVIYFIVDFSDVSAVSVTILFIFKKELTILIKIYVTSEICTVVIFETQQCSRTVVKTIK